MNPGVSAVDLWSKSVGTNDLDAQRTARQRDSFIRGKTCQSLNRHYPSVAIIDPERPRSRLTFPSEKPWPPTVGILRSGTRSSSKARTRTIRTSAGTVTSMWSSGWPTSSNLA